jgi:hypothetical protein
MHGLLSATWLTVLRVFMGTFPIDVLSRDITPARAPAESDFSQSVATLAEWYWAPAVTSPQMFAAFVCLHCSLANTSISIPNKANCCWPIDACNQLKITLLPSRQFGGTPA